MKCKLRSSLIFFALGAAFAGAILPCVFCVQNAGDKMFEKNNFKGCELQIQTFQRDGSARQKLNDNPEYIESISKVLLEAEKFRPRTMAQSEPELIYYLGATFTDETKQFGARLFNNSEQLAADYIYREKPLIIASIATKTDDGEYTVDEVWYCYLTPIQYSHLKELLYDGQI